MGKLFGFIPLPGRPRMTESKWFEKQARKAFDDCDIDKDGLVDIKECYIGLLKLYDLLNRVLPCHVKIPRLVEVNRLMEKYDTNDNKKFEFNEFLECSKGLVGNRRNWRDSLILKISFVVALKLVGFPYAAKAIKASVEKAGIKQAEKVPVSVIALMLEIVYKKGVAGRA